MKKLLLFLILLPFITDAQDWHCVPNGQHNIYRVSVSGADSMWDGYVRNIYVHDTINYGSLLQYNFYKSLRRNQHELMDSIKGPTWLGRFILRQPNGDEQFRNKYEDNILIKTKATLNQSWTMGSDTSGSVMFEATITSTDTITIDGILDSIKTIDVQAYIGSNPTASIYNNYQIILSKAHGFVRVFDLYGFPNYNVATTSGMSLSVTIFDSTISVYPILPYPHVRLDDSISKKNYVRENLIWQYQPGNEWIREHSGYLPNYSYDSIATITILSPDTIVVSVRRDSLWYMSFLGPPPYYAQVFSSGTYFDTIINSNRYHDLTMDSIENYKSGGAPYPYNGFYGINWHFLYDYCGNKMLVRDTFSAETAVSGFDKGATYSFEGLNNGSYHRLQHNGMGQYPWSQNSLIYYNLNGCTWGNFISLKPTSLNNIYKDDRFQIYPNPASSIFYIKSDHDWKHIELISLQGQVIKSFTKEQSNNMNVADLPSGIYIVKIYTKEGNYLQKLFVE